ncbi:MFS transporter [Blastococcus saxobsidens]|uniref:MFS transporter n=1 Tax=Blastococcus saxobsidens TaxID=138336 RepID=UPI000CEC9AF2|nr:MFS transporter [Blastococcus saxobsidens]
MREPVRSRALVPPLVFVVTVAALVASLGVPLIPTIAHEYGVSPTAAQWALTVTLLVAAVTTPGLGRLGDGPWRKKAVVGVLLVVLAGCVLAALPLGFPTLLAGRALQGLAMGLSALAVVTALDHVPVHRARSAVAMLSITTTAGVGFGFPVTGLLTDLFGLSAGFWLGAALCAVAALLTIWILPAPPEGPAQRFDVLGALLLGAGLAGVLVLLSQGPQWGVASWQLPALAAGSLIALVVWVRQELRTAVPLVDVRLLRHRPVLTAAVTGILTGIGMYLLFSIVIRLVQTPTAAGYGFGASVVVAGLTLLPFSLASVGGSRCAALIGRRIGPRAVLPLGAVTALAGASLFTVAHDSLWPVFAAMGLTGLGVGCTFAALPGLILAAVPPRRAEAPWGSTRFCGWRGSRWEAY